jgi:integrase
MERMDTHRDQISAFQKVGECLYRYSANGVYYAWIKKSGKQIRRSLRTSDRALADRMLRKMKDGLAQVDPSKGKMTLAQLCDVFLKTVQHQKPKTVERKTCIVNRIKSHWPTGSSTQVGKIKPSDVQLWLSRYSFGPASRNLHLACVKDIFAMAVGDGVIIQSPAAGIQGVKRDNPIRKTPSFEQFQAIVENIRAQVFNGHDANESADFVEFIGLAGLGQAEASALTWDDIDWRRGREQITTFRHKTKTGFAIPLYPQLRPLLERRHAQRSPDETHVFRIKDAKRAIAAACKRLKLPAYSHRSFRRMFVTRCLEKGVDVKVIAQWQGHVDGGQLILKVYSHVRPIHSQRMAALMTLDEPENVIPMPEAEAS